MKKPVTLAAIKADPKFKEMKLVRQSRLSVSPVSDEHWKLLLKMASGQECRVIDNTRGILAMSAAVVVFIFNDALIKLAAESDAGGPGDRRARRVRHACGARSPCW